ncbi:unnamed protein product [Paramecium pentaurelia]|uniref:Transmembrane protein n=1 Tax=Paramecium pentaurelia TaxID=43138 RepID=A0A8S1X6A3_9CILI|nr:unnamed protein product [Paramecium pentaurelia]
MGDLDCDCGDCGDLGGICNDCGDCGECTNMYGDCKNCCQDCCDCNNLDCDCCENQFCRDGCQRCFSNPVANHSRLRRFVSSLIIFVLLVVQWVTSVSKIQEYQNNKVQITNIQEMLKIGPINDLSLLTQCPSNTIVITNYTIPSTVAGCYCPNQNDKLSVEICNTTQTDCTILSASNEIQTSNWGYNESMKRFQLCAQRTSTNFEKLRQLKIKLPEDCKTNNLKLCQDMNNELNFFCVEKTEKCPIKDVQRNNQILKNYEKIDQAQIIDDQYVIITRNSSNNYIINFNITRGQGICEDRKKLSQGVGEDYIMNTQIWEPCNLDLSFNQLFKLKFEDFLEFNDLTDKFQKTRPLYNYSQNIQLVFQTSLPTLNIINFCSLFDDIEFAINLLSLFILISMSYWIYMIVIIINEICRCIFNAAESCGQKCKQHVTAFLFYYVRFAIQIPLIVLSLLGFLVVIQTDRTIKTISIENINDQISEQILTFSSTISQSILNQYKLLQGLVFAQFLLDIIISIWAYYEEHKKKKKKQYQLYNLSQIVSPQYLQQTNQKPVEVTNDNGNAVKKIYRNIY